MGISNHAFENPMSMLSCSYNNLHSVATGPYMRGNLHQYQEEQFLDRPLDPSLQEPDILTASGALRNSLKMTILSSDSAVVRLEQKLRVDEALKDQWVMNRMEWLSRLQVLFSSLESFVDKKQSHIEKNNFIEALHNIRSVLPLQDPEEYYAKTNQTALSFNFVRD